MASENGCGLCKIKVDKIGVKKGPDVLLSDVSFELHCGELTALIGVNGAGKTTLVKSILGEIKHQGTVSFESHCGEKLSKITIGYVPQHLDFDRSAPISVEDFLMIGRTVSPVCFIKKKKISRELDEILETVGCKDLKEKRLGDLSGGELQRVMLAFALNPVPDLLILDEPISGVDQRGMDIFYNLVAELRKEHHIAVILVSHDFALVEKYATKVALIDKKIIAHGKAEEVFRSKEFFSVFGYPMGGAKL